MGVASPSYTSERKDDASVDAGMEVSVGVVSAMARLARLINMAGIENFISYFSLVFWLVEFPRLSQFEMEKKTGRGE